MKLNFFFSPQATMAGSSQHLSGIWAAIKSGYQNESVTNTPLRATFTSTLREWYSFFFI